MRRTRERGQVLVLFVGGMVGLLALAALAIDLSSVYSTQQMEKAAADAAALAGGQELQKAGTRSVGSDEQAKAQQRALEDLAGRFNVDPVPTGSGCSSNPIVNCQLTPSLRVSISSPSKTTSDPRSVQVTVQNPNFQLSFARIFGQNGWNVAQTSVAVIDFASKYALMTLQPPLFRHDATSDFNQDKDLVLGGTNTLVTIVTGDVGSNTYVRTNSGNMLTLGDGYLIEHIDVMNPDTWNKDAFGNPKGKLITDLIQDPRYPLPSRTAVPADHQYASQAAGEDPICTGAPTLLADMLPAGAKCYKPGIYASSFNVQGSLTAAYLEPGAFFFDGGVDVRTQLLGGLVSNHQGVVLVIPQTQTFTTNSAQKVWLNKGGSACSADDCRATPALDAANVEIKTPAGLVLTIEVPRVNSCFALMVPKLCGNDNGSGTVRLPGNGQVFVAGVIYGPSDKMQINGNGTDQIGAVGQIVSWSVTYDGGAHLTQAYPAGNELGILRLDTACSGGDTPCSP